MKKFFFIFILQAGFIFSFSTEEFLMSLDPASKEELLSQKFIYLFNYNNYYEKNLKFMPKVDYSEEILERISSRAQTAIGEFIFYSKKKPNQSSTNLLSIYNNLNSISKFVEANFYNKNKKIDRQLFVEAYRINSEDNILKVNDLKFNKIPSFNEQYIFLQPKPFNSVRLKSLYSYNGKDVIYMNATSLDSLKYNVKLVNDNNLLIDIIIFEDADGIILYGVQSAKINTFLGMKPPKGMVDLLEFRFEGLFKWFSNRYLTNL